MTPPDLPPEPWTIEGVMDHLRQRVRPERTEEPGARPLAVPTVLDGDPGRDVDALIRAVEAAGRVVPQYRIRSHRPGIGRLVDLARRVLHWGSRPFIDELADRQTVANEATVRALRAVHRRLEVVIECAARWQEVLDAERRVAALEREVRQFQTSQLRINAEIEAFARVARERQDLAGFFEGLPADKRRELMDRFRGPTGEIWGWHHIYVEHLRNRPGQILDLGCGRGELLDMLRGEGIEAWGCDLDPVALEMCHARGVHAVRMDVLSALRTAAPAALGGVFSSQVIEHLHPGEVVRVLQLARAKIAPGGVLVIETINPQSLGALAKSFYADLDHKQLIDPGYLRELVELVGFVNVETRLIHDFKPEDKLPEVPSAIELGLSDRAHATLQDIVGRLNRAIWAPQDYYVIGEVPRG